MDKISDFLVNQMSGKTRLILIYRYFSWILTSVFYFFGKPYSPLFFKLGVIVSLFIALLIVKDLLIKNETNPTSIKTLVIVETIGIMLLLIPTGGIESPFIWYALNPVLIAASLLSGLFCWGLLLFYMITSTLLTYTFFHNQTTSLIDIFNQNSYLYLVLILIAIVFQLFTNLTNELNSQAIKLKEQRQKLLLANSQLTDINLKSNEAMEHIMSLYQTVESFTTQHSIQTLAGTVLDYTEKLTKTESAFCWVFDEEGNGPLLTIPDNDGYIQDILKEQLKEQFATISENQSLFSIKLQQKIYQVVAIQSTRYNGFLGIEYQGFLSSDDGRLLKFLADLSSVILERFYLEENLDQFMIVEEQNRIANEIHDSVSQRIFGLVFGLHSLEKRLDQLSVGKIVEELEFLGSSANAAMKELRSSIYKLSTKKRGETLLFRKIEEYLKEMGQLHSINIHTTFLGDENAISYPLKNGVYRIVCEACGNAIRHGKSQNIKVSIAVLESEIELLIIDDGLGFDVSSVKKERKIGIGLHNMKSLVHSFGGIFELSSEQNNGTEIIARIPMNNQNQEVVGL